MSELRQVLEVAGRSPVAAQPASVAVVSPAEHRLLEAIACREVRRRGTGGTERFDRRRGWVAVPSMTAAAVRLAGLAVAHPGLHGHSSWELTAAGRALLAVNP